MALRGTLTHRKTRRLAALLGVDQSTAMGKLEALWHVTSECQFDGGIGRMSNQDIADEMYHTGDADALIESLTVAGWLDRTPGVRLYVHDWHTHADDSTKGKLIQWTKLFANGRPPSLRRFKESMREKIIARYGRIHGESVAREMRNSRDNPDEDESSRDVARECATTRDVAQFQKPDSRSQIPEARGIASVSDTTIDTPQPPTDSPSQPQSQRDREDDFNRLYSRHPQAKRKHRGLAITTYGQTIASGVDPDLIDRVHIAMCQTETWRWKSGAQAVTLAEWLIDRGWEHPPDGVETPQPRLPEPIDTRTDEQFFAESVAQLVAGGDSETEARVIASGWVKQRRLERGKGGCEAEAANQTAA